MGHVIAASANIHAMRAIAELWVVAAVVTALAVVVVILVELRSRRKEGSRHE